MDNLFPEAPQNSQPAVSTNPALTPANQPPAPPATPPVSAPEGSGLPKRTKLLLALIGIVVVGAIAYFLSTTTLFKGAFLVPGSPEEIALKEALQNASDAEKASYEVSYKKNHTDSANRKTELTATATGEINFQNEGAGLTHNFTFAGTGSQTISSQTDTGDGTGTGTDTGDNTGDGTDGTPPPPPPPPPTIAAPTIEFPQNLASVTLPLTLKWQDPENTAENKKIYQWEIKNAAGAIVWNRTFTSADGGEESCEPLETLPGSWSCLSATVPEGKLSSGKYTWSVAAGNGTNIWAVSPESTFYVEELEQSCVFANLSLQKPAKAKYSVEGTTLAIVDVGGDNGYLKGNLDCTDSLAEFFISANQKPEEKVTLTKAGEPDADGTNHYTFTHGIGPLTVGKNVFTYRVVHNGKIGFKVESVNILDINEEFGAPEDLKINYKPGATNIELEWKQPPVIITDYVVYRAKGAIENVPTPSQLANAAIWTKIETKSTTTKFLDNATDPTKNMYSYVVTSHMGTKESFPSNVAVSIPDKIGKNIILEVTSISQKKVKLEWQTSLEFKEGETYIIRRSTNPNVFPDTGILGEIPADGTETTFEDEKLPTEKEFYYKVFRKTALAVEFSNVEKVVIPVATLTAEKVILNENEHPTFFWTFPEKFNEQFVEKYFLYRSTGKAIDLDNPSPTTAQFEIKNPETKSFIDEILKGNDGSTHYYALVLKNKEGEIISISNQISLAFDSALKKTPTITLTAKRTGYHRVNLQWTGGTANAATSNHYAIYRIEGTEAKIAPEYQYTVTALDGTKNIDVPIYATGEYTFLVTADELGNIFGVLEVSNPATVKIGEPPVLSVDKSDLKEAGEKPTFTWTDDEPADQIQKNYTLYRKKNGEIQSSDGVGVAGYPPKDGEKKFTDEKLILDGGTYHYRLARKYQDGTETYSNEIVVTTGELENAIQATVKKTGEKEFTVNWSGGNIAQTSQYQVVWLKIPDGENQNVETIEDVKIKQHTVTVPEYGIYSVRVFALNENITTFESSALMTIKFLETPTLELSVVKQGQKELNIPVEEGKLGVPLVWTVSNPDSIAYYTIYQSKSSPVDVNAGPAQGVYQFNVNDPQATAFTDTSTALGNTYYYVVVGKNSNALTITEPSNEVKVVVEKPAEKKPISLTIGAFGWDTAKTLEPLATSVQLTWDMHPVLYANILKNTKKYSVYKSKTLPVDTTDPQTFVADVPLPAANKMATHNDKSLVSDGSTYYYEIFAKDEAEKVLAESNLATVKTQLKPAVLSAKVEGLKIKLSWTDTDQSIIGYRMYRSKTANIKIGETNNLTMFEQLPKGTTAFEDKTYDETGKDYFYVVASVNSTGGIAAVSNEAGAKSPIIVSATLSNAFEDAEGTILQWEDPYKAIIDVMYRIYRSEEPFKKDEAGNVDLNDIIAVKKMPMLGQAMEKLYLDADAEPGKTYYYVVTTLVGSKPLAVSTEKSVTAWPIKLSVVKTGDQSVELKWIDKTPWLEKKFYKIRLTEKENPENWEWKEVVSKKDAQKEVAEYSYTYDKSKNSFQLENNKKYYFRVQIYYYDKEIQESAIETKTSNVVSATPEAPPAASTNDTSWWKPFASLFGADVTSDGDANGAGANSTYTETISGTGSLTDGAGTLNLKDEYVTGTDATNTSNKVTANLTLTVAAGVVANSAVTLEGTNADLAFVTENYVKEKFLTNLNLKSFLENHEKSVLKNLKKSVKENIKQSNFIDSQTEITDGKFRVKGKKMLGPDAELPTYLSNASDESLDLSVDATSKLPALQGVYSYGETGALSYKIFNFTPKAGSQQQGDGQQQQQQSTAEIKLDLTGTDFKKLILAWKDSGNQSEKEYAIYRSESALNLKKGDSISSISTHDTVKGATYIDNVPQSDFDYHYIVALVDSQKKITKISNELVARVVSSTVSPTPAGGGSNPPSGGGGPSLQDLLAAQKIKDDAAAAAAAAKQKPVQPFKPAPENPYSDVTPKTYGYDAILKLTQDGTLEGYKEKGKQLFKPTKAVNRAEASKLILKSVCVEPTLSATGTEKQIYSDVPLRNDTYWFFMTTKEAYNKGYFTGYKDKVDQFGRRQFRPANQITRVELVKVLIEVLRRKGFIKTPAIKATQPWWIPFLGIAKNISLYWVNQTQPPVIKQLLTDKEALDPTRVLTRADTAILIDRMVQLTGGCDADVK